MNFDIHEEIRNRIVHDLNSYFLLNEDAGKIVITSHVFKGSVYTDFAVFRKNENKNKNKRR